MIYCVIYIQIFRGAAATPNAIMEPGRGKWWNGK